MSIYDPKSSYTPQLAKPRPWSAVQRTFGNLIERGWDLQPISDLIFHIRSTYGPKRLFAQTSMTTLIVANYRPIEHFRDSLFIEYASTERKVQFRYFAKPFSEAEFERTYAPDLIIPKFDAFVRMIRW